MQTNTNIEKEEKALSGLIVGFEQSLKNQNLKKWFLDFKDSVVAHIDSLDYSQLKEMHISCEKDMISLRKEVESGNKGQEQLLQERQSELSYITMSMDYCKENISNIQYDVLNDFANSLYYHKHRKEDKSEVFDSSYWANLLDKENISWSVQNFVSGLTDNYENKGKYLSTHLKNEGISVGVLNKRVENLHTVIDNISLDNKADNSQKETESDSQKQLKRNR